MKLTEEQQIAISLALEAKNLKIEAFAGTGKTTTLREIGKAKEEKRGLYLAFNRAIADYASSSFSRNVKASTAHSVAFANFGKPYGDRLKGRLTGKSLARELGVQDWQMIKAESLCRLAIDTIARYCHSDKLEINRYMVPTSDLEAVIKGKVDESDLKSLVVPIAQKALERMLNLSSNLPITHDLYLKKWALSNPELKYDFILFDEAQDANPVLLDILKKQSCQVIFVGDQYQQIYSWRGAVNAMSGFRSGNVCYLTQSFRFGNAIAELANEILEKLLRCTHKISGNPKIQSSIMELLAPKAVLCRTNAEAISQLAFYVRRSMKVFLQGGTSEMQAIIRGISDLKNGLIPSSPDLRGFTTFDELVDYSESESGKDLQVILKLIKDHGESSLLSLLEMAGRTNKETADITISTAHKAKGQEWESVQLTSDFRGPDANTYTPEEANLLYVAVTRAIRTLDISGCTAIDEIKEMTAPWLPPKKNIADFDAGDFDFEAVLAKPQLHTNEPTFVARAGAAADIAVQESENASPGLESSPRRGRAPERLTDQQLAQAREYLIRARVENRNDLALSPDAFNQLDPAAMGNESLRRWIENHMSKEGRRKMLGALRQKKFQTTVKNIALSDDVAKKLAKACRKSNTSASDLIDKLLSMHDAVMR